MIERKPRKNPAPRATPHQSPPSVSVEQMLLDALASGGDGLTTGRQLVTFKEGAATEGVQFMKARGLRTADARDFSGQAVRLQDLGDADGIVLPAIGVAVVSGAAAERGAMVAQFSATADSAIQSIDPEYFVFSSGAEDYLRGFARAAEIISRDIGSSGQFARRGVVEEDDEVLVAGATWGLVKCKVPPSTRSGAGITVAVLDTGMDLGHPDFAGRTIIGETFVGQPVQDLHSHGTHCIGTACGPLAPAGSTPRYGIAYKSSVFAGKVLSNSGSSVDGSVLAGMNWAIANRCTVISMSLGSQAPVHPAYTAAGNAALNNGCLIVAAAGNRSIQTGSPANSPSIMSVASLDENLSPSNFSNFGKVEIAAPGRDVYSSVPRPNKYGYMSGTSMATPHVAGCAALWAETSPTLRGMALWNKLLATAMPLPFPASRVGRGLVQAP